VAGLQSALAGERARGGALVAALAEARSGAGAAALAQGERERGLQVRLADAEARLAQEQSRRANEAAEAASAHAHQLAELQSQLESAESERAAQRSLHHERLSAVESELQAALSRASGLEDAQRDSAARFQTLAAKLKQGGQAYEAQLNYGTKLAAENAALRAEAEKQLGAQAAQIASCTAQLRESQSLAEDLTRRVEDAYAKMVLLNRALVAAQERGDRTAQVAEEHAQRGALLAAEMGALRQAHERLRGETERRDAEAQALRAQLDASRAEHARAEQQRDAQVAQLEAQLDEVTAAERAASAQAARLDESLRTQRARTQSLEQQAAIAARAAAEQASRLDAAEAELQKHHQLAAMIHKLSGQAALPVPAPSAGAGANNHA
jgi:chromosome segregation ATPase